MLRVIRLSTSSCHDLRRKETLSREEILMAINDRSIFIKSATIVIFLLICLYLVSPLLIPIIFAATIAMAIHPLMQKLESFGMARNKAAALLTTALFCLISLPFLFFLLRGALAVTEHLQSLPNIEVGSDQTKSMAMTFRTAILEKFIHLKKKLNIGPLLTADQIDFYLKKINVWLLKLFQGMVANVPGLFISFLVVMICTYSFLRHASSIRNSFQKVFGMTAQTTDQLVLIFINNSRMVYISNIITGSVQSTIVATSVYFFDLGDFFLVFFITLILSFIPVIGAAPVAFIFSLYAFFYGNTTQALMMAVVGSFAGVIDNFLRPYLASLGQSRLPIAVAFVFVLGGVLTLGFSGLFVGPLVGSFAYDIIPLLWRDFTEKNLPISSIFKVTESSPNLSSEERH
jgi:predicted PurR-regulated permease PerM